MAAALSSVVCLGASAAEQWECRFLLSDRGVQFPEVRDFVEDRAGRIWASSWGNGVARIHGTSWKTYTEADGLGSDWVRGLALGEDGTVWISTPGGLACIQGEKLKSIHTSALPQMAGDEPDLIFMTRGGDLIISTYYGAIFRAPGVSSRASMLWEAPERWQVLLSRDDPGAARVSDFAENENGELVVALKDETWAEVKGGALKRTPGPGGTMYLTRGADHNSLWAGSAPTPDSSVIVPLNADSGVGGHRLAEDVRGLSLGPDEWCYAATTTGLFRFNERAIARVDLGYRVGFPDINEVFFASDGSLWLGTREGIVRGAPHTWKHYPATEQGHAIVTLLHDPADPERLIAVDDKACLARLEEDTWTETVSLAAPEALDGFATFANRPIIWAMGDGTLFEFNIVDGSLAGRYPMPAAGTDRKLFMTSGGELWLCAVDGVHALTDGVWEARPAVPDYVRRTVHALYETAPGVVYAGVSDGIERWEGGTITYYGADADVAEDDQVNSICPTADGKLWFGTFGSGVYIFDGIHFEQVDDRNGLAHHSISNILQTDDGTVWLSYRRVGIASYRDERWMNFGYERGLTNAPIKQLVEDGEGSLWLVTGREGIYQYRPDAEAPETRITAATETVPHQGIGVFSFQASDAWQRTPAHALLFSWRVLGESGRGELTPWNNFTPETAYIADSLAPGTYQFEVRASDDARNVDPTPAAVSFVVSDSPWREPRILVPAALLISLLAVVLVLRIRGHRALRRSETALLQSNRQLMNEIKERLQAEKRLNDHFEQLEELVRGRTSELEAAQRALVEQERLATLGKVTASVSHELRNPLGTLRSTLFMIGRKVQGTDLGLEEALARGERSIQRCDRIIEEFLDFTRTVAMERESVAMDPWLKELLGEIAIPEGVDTSFNLESGISLDVDPERLRRAVVNVINNAVQAMSEHDNESKCLCVESRVRDGRFEIVIQDNGPGMAEDSIPRIFEPLYSTKGFGVGLGVPIVKDIMDRHQGGLEYHSVLGQGTTVVLWIPHESQDVGAMR